MSVLLPFWQRLVLVLAVGFLAGLFVLGLRYFGALQTLELDQYDVSMARLAEPQVLSDVVLLALTDEDLARWGWPVPDAQIAAITQASLNAGARAVGVDIYRDVPVGDGRAELLEILADPRVTVISRLETDGVGGVAAPEGVRSGFADIPIDPDGVARRALLLVNTENGIELSFPMQVAMTHLGTVGLRSVPSAPDTLQFGQTAVPRLPARFGPYQKIDNAGYQILSHFRHELPMVSQVSASRVLAGEAKIAGKSVVIAVTSDTVKDYFLTPLNRRTGAAFTFGGELHAAVAQQIIDHAQGTLAPFSAPREDVIAAMVLGAALSGAMVAALMRITLVALLAAVAGAITLYSTFALTQAQAQLLPALPVTLAWGTGFTIYFVILASIAWRQRKVMAGIFASQLSRDLSSELWRQRKTLIAGHKPVSRSLFVTVLMADVEGSTRTGQQLEPDAFMRWISRILDALGDCAQRHGGFVEKYTGDGILVVFGAPIPRETQAEVKQDANSALACAEEMRALALAMNGRTGDPDYRLRIGINSGEVVAGTLGTTGAMRYNVIGDTVNVAARLEAWIKSQPDDSQGMRPICMTQATADLIGTDDLQQRADRLLHDDGETHINVYTRA